jgi:LemA protein
VDYLVWVPLVLAGILGLFAYTRFNRLVALDERCQTAFSDIDVLLKHRHSVIPALVETVRGFAGQESALFQSITQARAEALRAATPEMRLAAEAQLGKRITTLIQTADRYPELQSSSHFRELRIELVDIENRITASRRFFNLTVDEFNATLRQFPGNIVGVLARFGRRNRFDVGSERLLLDEPVSFKF